ncbi:MAG: hypothetical protein ACFE0J_02240 [Elainellaceae cyanobacterium]
MTHQPLYDSDRSNSDAPLDSAMEVDDIDQQIGQGVKDLIQTIQDKIFSKRLSEPVYRELGVLLELLPYIDLTNNIDLLHMARFAASLLMADPESKDGIDSEPAKPMYETGIRRWLRKLPGFSTPKEMPGNVLLARKIRKSIAGEIRYYRSPLWAILSANGSPASQLISGLTWFFIIFVITPVMATLLFVSVRSRIEEDYSAGFNLGFDLGFDLAAQQAQESPLGPTDDIEDNTVTSGQPPQSGSPQSGIITPAPSASGRIEVQPADRGGGLGSEQPLFTREEVQRFFLVVVSGSIGSVVSVMVRLRSVDAQNRAKSMAPFFSGFFKPIIGTAFAIFIVALFETNIVAFPSIQSGTPQKYLYIVLAFTAGFSEILVPDILTKTEQSIAGNPSSSKSKKPE